LFWPTRPHEQQLFPQSQRILDAKVKKKLIGIPYRNVIVHVLVSEAYPEMGQTAHDTHVPPYQWK
jgi:hypothetical protein